ncbi:MAG: MCE family protein, partial [Deltaproteobacteria bacterium]|nr:MCE family protein [Deltaproteobacteria bacterium]
MNKKLKAPLLVGLVAAAGVLGAILLFGGVEDRIVGGAGTYRVYALFSDVSGLARYSRVTMAGIPIGKIDDIVLSDENGVKAKVILEISDSIVLYSGIWDDAQRFYKNGATITRRTATMLGDYYLDISPGIEGEKLRDGMRIPNIVGEAGMGALVKKMEELTDIFPTLNKIALDISVITTNLSDVLGGQEGHERMDTITREITSTSKDLAMIAKDFRGFLEKDLLTKTGSLEKIVRNFEIFSQNAAYISQATGDSLVKTMKNFEVITGEIKDFLGKSGTGDQKIEGLRDSIEKLNKSLDELQIAVTNMRSVTEKVDSGQGTLGRLINDDKLVDKIEEMAEETGNLVKSFTRLETIVGFRSEYNYHQSAMKHYFSLKLQPRQDKYYLLELVFDPKGSTSTVDRGIFTTDPL